ncbi:MAG: UDP-glucose 4-epimerase GalE [Candidatus Saccharimonas sp.]
MHILVTGGTGYIGSHTVVELLNAGHQITIVDNLINSSEKVIERIRQITNMDVDFIRLDLCDHTATQTLFASRPFDAVIHFAGLKAVGESVDNPLLYYQNNLDSSLSLLMSMKEYDVRKLVFSSSATVYGDPGTPRYTESLPTGHSLTNPYGKTKYMIEEIISDICSSDPTFETTILRYFNPIGAHESGLIGEDPLGVPNNLMPFISQVAAGKREKLSIFGNDYPTPDGTCRRDYIHVVDLAKGHLAALNRILPGYHVFNLGSGNPLSVLDLVKAFTDVTGVDIPYEFAARRPGDLAEFYADPLKATSELQWKTTKTLHEMCSDTWKWQSQNPNGYK